MCQNNKWMSYIIIKLFYLTSEKKRLNITTTYFASSWRWGTLDSCDPDVIGTWPHIERYPMTSDPWGPQCYKSGPLTRPRQCIGKRLWTFGPRKSTGRDLSGPLWTRERNWNRTEPLLGSNRSSPSWHPWWLNYFGD